MLKNDLLKRSFASHESLDGWIAHASLSFLSPIWPSYFFFQQQQINYCCCPCLICCPSSCPLCAVLAWLLGKRRRVIEQQLAFDAVLPGASWRQRRSLIFKRRRQWWRRWWRRQCTVSACNGADPQFERAVSLLLSLSPRSHSPPLPSPHSLSFSPFSPFYRISFCWVGSLRPSVFEFASVIPLSLFARLLTACVSCLSVCVCEWVCAHARTSSYWFCFTYRSPPKATLFCCCCFLWGPIRPLVSSGQSLTVSSVRSIWLFIVAWFPFVSTLSIGWVNLIQTNHKASLFFHCVCRHRWNSLASLGWCDVWTTTTTTFRKLLHSILSLCLSLCRKRISLTESESRRWWRTLCPHSL